MAVDDYRFRKRLAESRPFGFDFAADLAEGETLVSATFVITDADNGAVVTGMLVGGAACVGSVCRQRIEGGVSGKLCRVTATATTASGNVLAADALLSVT